MAKQIDDAVEKRREFEHKMIQMEEEQLQRIKDCAEKDEIIKKLRKRLESFEQGK